MPLLRRSCAALNKCRKQLDRNERRTLSDREHKCRTGHTGAPWRRLARGAAADTSQPRRACPPCSRAQLYNQTGVAQAHTRGAARFPHLRFRGRRGRGCRRAAADSSPHRDGRGARARAVGEARCSDRPGGRLVGGPVGRAVGRTDARGDGRAGAVRIVSLGWPRGHSDVGLGGRVVHRLVGRAAGHRAGACDRPDGLASAAMPMLSVVRSVARAGARKGQAVGLSGGRSGGRRRTPARHGDSAVARPPQHSATPSAFWTPTLAPLRGASPRRAPGGAHCRPQRGAARAPTPPGDRLRGRWRGLRLTAGARRI